mgnify:FL=1
MKISVQKLSVETARKCWDSKVLREKAEISTQTIQNIKRGKEVLPITAGKIARALGVDVADLLENKGE